MEILEKVHHQNMTLIVAGMIRTFHYIDGSCHKATNGYFTGHLNAAYFVVKLEDLQSDFMTRMLTIVLVMCLTETDLVP